MDYGQNDARLLRTLEHVYAGDWFEVEDLVRDAPDCPDLEAAIESCVGKNPAWRFHSIDLWLNHCRGTGGLELESSDIGNYWHVRRTAQPRVSERPAVVIPFPPRGDHA